ncbi:MAG: hypothetical protein J7639_33995, partial [Paenibacillaceae bacterium]|nr:hypothetical protein [Paenibacillaceae bacterium]
YQPSPRPEFFVLVRSLGSWRAFRQIAHKKWLICPFWDAALKIASENTGYYDQTRPIPGFSAI